MKKKAVIISCFDWYKARIEPIREVLHDKGYEVTVLTSDYDHIKKQIVNERYPECTYIQVPQYKKNISLQRIHSHMVFGKKVKKLLNDIQPKLVYLLIPPNNTAKYCAQYREKNSDTKLVLDIIDLWPESMPLGKSRTTPPTKVWQNWRDDAIREADYVFTECELYQKELAGVIDLNKTSTLHLFKKQTVQEKRIVESYIEKQSNDEVIKFAYLGSMNSIIDIEGICRVIKQFVEMGRACELHAIGDGESKDTFEKAVSDTGCKAVFYGKVFDENKKMAILCPCDYAFNMMKETVSVGLTIKSIDYLSYGLPLINNIKGDTWDLVEKMKIGINVNHGEDKEAFEKINRIKVLNVFEDLFTLNTFEGNIKEKLQKMRIIDD